MTDLNQCYAGFDRHDCPPLDMMARLRKETNLRWCGYYLHAPSQPALTWLNRRAALVNMGWGLAPIYVGRQTTGPGAKLAAGVIDAKMQGGADGRDAALEMGHEGFARGSYVYLDIENGPPASDAQLNYIGAWADAVRDTGYAPGVYCSYKLADKITLLDPSLRVWVFRVPSTVPVFVSGKAFSTKSPTLANPRATLWQYFDEARLSDFGNLACDLDVATMPDPSAPDAHMQRPAPPPDVPAPTNKPAPSPATPSLLSSLWGIIRNAMQGRAG